MGYFKLDRMMNKNKDEKAKKFVAERLPVMQIETKAYKEEVRKPKYSFGKATEADIEDFKKVYFKKVMPEEQSKSYSYGSHNLYKSRERKMSYEVKEPVQRESYRPVERTYERVAEKPVEKKPEAGLFSMFG